MVFKHPEAAHDEVFLCNVFPQSKNGPGFENIHWETKRQGSTAYATKTGTVLLEGFPVFVKRTELERAGIDPDSEPPFKLKQS